MVTLAIQSKDRKLYGWGENLKNREIVGFPDGPVVKNLPANTGVMGSMSRKIARAVRQLRPCATTTEPVHNSF